MLQSIAILSTSTGSRYITRLCKHWGHRFQVEFDEHHGLVNFGDSICELTATPTTLSVSITAKDDEIAEMETVVEEHLLRFVSKDEVLTFTWERAPRPD